ncbi:hypothetical protein D777_00357 [Marinobacter nitratireducens]|uniref:Uncharacterized protein n=1 Tax=Marinobacter nitratireducens TaxID=1137280 RepID=A0A072MWP5_9GAMM|nr:hypothetical protein D777_00357 [Marinobacter nitratireducens]
MPFRAPNGVWVQRERRHTVCAGVALTLAALLTRRASGACGL